LLGLVIEAITGESYSAWIDREIVAAAGLRETSSDMPAKGRNAVALARGHSAELPAARRFVIPGDNPTHALAAATGFVSTAGDVARFFAQLAPNAKRSLLSAGSRREMTRKQWRNPDASLEGYYGLGLMSGSTGGWDWFGHTGAFQGYISKTSVIPARDLAITVLTNAIDGLAVAWIDGIIHILRAFTTRGAPTRRVRDWDGRWWGLWGAVDLVPIGNRVIAASPALLNPLLDATEIEVTGRDAGRVVLAPGFRSYGEAVRRTRSKGGTITDIWIAGGHLTREKAIAAEIERRYSPRKRRAVG
jgi:hypothetical protein